MARFKWRAPYFKSVPSRSRNCRAAGITRNRKRPLAVSSTRCCTIPSSISRICSSCSDRSGWNTIVLSIRFMNSGANFRFAASAAVFSTFSSSRGFESAGTVGANPIPPVISSVISPPPRFDVMKIIVCDRSTRRLSPSVSVALSKIPSSNFHNASDAFSISSNSRIESFNFSVNHWFRASCVINGCVSRCPKYPGGDPISLAISCECWNSAQSTLITARGSPNRISAAASTMRVLPEPVGPRNSRFPTGRPVELIPAQKTWYRSTSARTPSSWPTTLLFRAAWNSCDSTLLSVGSSGCCAERFVLMTILLPELPVCEHTPIRGPIKLVEFDSYSGVQQTELRDNFLSRLRRMRNVQQGREQICQVKIESAEGGNEFLNLVGLGIEQLDAIVDLLAQLIPVHVHKGIGTGDLPHNVIGDAGTFPELGQVQLFDPVALADVVHQIKRVPFAAKKGH